VLVPNRTELALLAATSAPGSPAHAAEIAARLEGPGAVVVTLGADGAVVRDGRRTEHVAAPVVDAVDATGAGDAFCGGLADALARGAELVEAVRWAVAAAAISVTRTGALGAMPTRAEIEA
jgi:ribokinase